MFFWREFNLPSGGMGCWWSQIHGFIAFNAAREMTGDGMGPLYLYAFVVRPFNLPPILSCFFCSVKHGCISNRIVTFEAESYDQHGCCPPQSINNPQTPTNKQTFDQLSLSAMLNKYTPEV